MTAEIKPVTAQKMWAVVDDKGICFVEKTRPAVKARAVEEYGYSWDLLESDADCRIIPVIITPEGGDKGGSDGSGHSQ